MITTATAAGLFEGFPHVLRAQQFDPADLTKLFRRAEEIRKDPSAVHDVLKGQRVAVLFEEPSTRTFHSFLTAAEMLGVSVRPEQHSAKYSSEAKGETIEDTIRTFQRYGFKYFILRRTLEGSVERAAHAAGDRCPVINAGDGTGQHPTQALLDAYTIWRHFGRLDEPLHIGMVGDLKNGRTVHSLVYLLAKYDDVRFTFNSPESHRMKPGIIEYLTKHGRTFTERFGGDLCELVSNVSVLYVTRPQLEREEDEAGVAALIESYRDFIVTKSVAEAMPLPSIIMHPMPRTFELPEEVNDDPRARYFDQVENGLWIRMALLAAIAEGLRM